MVELTDAELDAVAAGARVGAGQAGFINVGGVAVALDARDVVDINRNETALKRGRRCAQWNWPARNCVNNYSSPLRFLRGEHLSN
jgi:hypothetical protein